MKKILILLFLTTAIFAQDDSTWVTIHNTLDGKYTMVTNDTAKTVIGTFTEREASQIRANLTYIINDTLGYILLPQAVIDSLQSIAISNDSSTMSRRLVEIGNLPDSSTMSRVLVEISNDSNSMSRQLVEISNDSTSMSRGTIQISNFPDTLGYLRISQAILDSLQAVIIQPFTGFYWFYDTLSSEEPDTLILAGLGDVYRQTWIWADSALLISDTSGFTAGRTMYMPAGSWNQVSYSTSIVDTLFIKKYSGTAGEVKWSSDTHYR